MPMMACSAAKGPVFVYAGAANKIYGHSCCVKISVSSDQQNFPFSVVAEKHRDVSLRAGARLIRPEF